MAVLKAIQSFDGFLKGFGDVLNADGGVVSIVSIALSALASLGDEFIAYMEQKRAENIQWIKAGADAVEGNFAYSDEVSEVEALLSQLSEGHLPLLNGEISLEKAKEYKDSMITNGMGTLRDVERGAVVEYDYQMYLGEIGRIIEAAKAREDAAWDVYVDTMNGDDQAAKDAAAENLELARQSSKEVMDMEMENALKVYTSETGVFFFFKSCWKPIKTRCRQIFRMHMTSLRRCRHKAMILRYKSL